MVSFSMPTSPVPSLIARLFVVLAFAAGQPCRAALVDRWSFNNAAGAAPSGTTIADSVGTAPATVVGNGATLSGSSLALPGTSTGNQTPANISAYVDLPNGLISSKTNLSVEIWATPVSIKNWQRLFDFGRMASSGTALPTNARGPGAGAGEILPTATQAPNGAVSSDDLSLAINQGTAASTQRLMARLNGATELGSNTAVTLTAGTQYHFVCTFTDGAGTYGTAGGQAAWYLNGTLVTTLDVNFHLSSIEDRNNWLGRSMYSGDNSANIAYNEVRLYDHVLTHAQIAANIAAGPDQLGDPNPVQPPVPNNLWTFTTQAQSQTPSGTTFTDSIGGAVATLRGNGGSLTGGAVVLPGTTTGNQPAAAISAYLDLPNGIVSQTASVSFEAWATPLSSKSWQRLFDFGRCVASHGTGTATGEILDDGTAPGVTAGYDNLSLTFNNAADINSQQLEGQQGGNAAQFSFSTATTAAGTKYHYVLVVQDSTGTYGASGCQARWYRNGLLQNSADFPFHITAIGDVNNWIGRSMYSGDSNSNMALDELRIYRRAITAAEVLASFNAGPDPSTGPAEPLPPAPVPENRWSFNSAAGAAADGTAFVDVGTGEIATVRGNGATTTGTTLVLPGTTTGNQTAATIAAYLDLRNGFVSSRPSATYEIWLTPISSKNWQRIFDFGRGSVTSGIGALPGEIIDGPNAPGATNSYDGLMLSLNNGGTLGSHRMEALSSGGTATTVNTDISGTTTAGTEYHYALVIDDGAGSYGSTGCQVRWYRNGILDGSMDLAYHASGFADVNNWIGRSAWSSDSNSNMAIDELRVHRRAVTPQELLASVAAGPNATFAPPVAVADSATIHPNQKVLIDVLKNDTGAPIASTLQIVGAPSTGTATVNGGKILYAHSGSSAAPVTFTYRVGNISGSTAVGTVTINFATSLRLTNTALTMPAAPPVNAWQMVDALPGLTFNQPICIASLPGDTHRMFVCERIADIQHIPDVTAAVPTKNTFLNLLTVIAGRSPVETIEGGGNAEFGLLGLAFHPQYATNGYFYVAYTVRISGGSYYERISRFKVSAADPTVADPSSELILLQQLDEGANHNGGDLHFGLDGYLYYTAGDEENGYDVRHNSQRINKDFYSGIFRLDVDKKPGNLEPSPHAAVPTDAGIARFSVPVDNPFVHTSLGGTWDGTYNSIAITPLNTVRTEFWCTGLRHTWRFSIDSATGDIWGGDVGQDTYEEVNKIVKGGNYGWVWREAAHETGVVDPTLGAEPAGFTSIDPIYEYVHTALAGDPQYKGNSVCGGYVYRGTRYPSLVGTYIFSDSVSGNIWQMNTTTGATVRITGLPGAYGVISSQGVDPSNQDLLFCAYLTGKIMRLSTGDAITGSFPTTLSGTGLFADLTDLSPAPGLLPYEPNLRFWSDYADKTRWFTIPDATSRMTWSKDGNWTFPTGMLWVKHFDLELSRGNPATKKRIETRVLVKTDTGIYGVSYRWNDAQTDATLVGDAGAQFDLAIDDNGTPHTQHWTIPSRTDCLTCHNPQAGHSLSFTTRQLNHTFTSNGYTGNELNLLNTYGFLNNSPDDPQTLDHYVQPTDTAYPLETRVRSYFAVNCAYCHQTGGSVSGFWDGRPQLTLEETGLINGVPFENGGATANKYIVPGDTLHSIVLNRMAATNGFSRMPPLATSEIDNDDVALVAAWINSGQPARPLYETWRATYFASGDPNGDRAADPNHNGLTNYQEYLLGNNPLGGTPWSSGLLGSSTPDHYNLSFLRHAFRRYNILISPDLVNWQRWNVPQNTSDYTTADQLEAIDFTTPESKYFFRLEVSEP